jgi:hypothetical protein
LVCFWLDLLALLGLCLRIQFATHDCVEQGTSALSLYSAALPQSLVGFSLLGWEKLSCGKPSWERIYISPAFRSYLTPPGLTPHSRIWSSGK